MATDEKQPSNRTQNVYAFSPKFQHSVNAGSQKVFVVLVILDGYPPRPMDDYPRKPTNATFHLPFSFKLASYFCQFGGHFGWISTTPNGRLLQKTHNRRHSSCHFHLKWLRIFAALGVILDGYRAPSMGDYPRTPKITFAPSLLFWAGTD